jgi:ABC-type transport system involved in multi-copper enzyme maturation permease subunit
MNASVFWRLAWKEYRLLRSFWIAMAVFAVLAQAYVLMAVSGADATVEALFFMGLALAAFYALGCGATLFATEHETGTYAFQQALPVSAGRLFWGKLAFAALSVPALFALVWLSALAFAAGDMPRPSRHLMLWGLWGVGGLELLAWGILFSLALKRPLQAAIYGVLCASITVHLLVAWFSTTHHLFILQDYSGALPARLVALALVAIVDVLLGLGWLREWSDRSDSLDALATARYAVRPDAARASLRRASRGGAFVRLVWQQWRQSTRLIFVLSILVIPLVLILGGPTFIRAIVEVFEEARWEAAFNVTVPPTGVLGALALLATPALAGAFVFLADQQNRSVTFLAERGVSANSVWLSRHFVFGGVTLIWIVFVSIMLGLVLVLDTFARVQDGLLLVGLLFLGAVCIGFAIAYASGQLCSMFFRSSILAGFFAIALSVALVGWARLMWALSVNWWWSVVPIPVVLFLATWLRAPHWMLGRNGIRGWLSSGSLLVVFVVGLPTAVALHRAFEFPLVDPGFSVEEFENATSAGARKTADMYLRAFDLYVKPQAETTDREVGTGGDDKPQREGLAAKAAWVDANRDSIALAVEASKRPTCDAFSLDPSPRLREAGGALGSLLRESAGLLQSEGKLDAALDRYQAALRVSLHMRARSRNMMGTADGIESWVYEQLPEWSALPGQTPARIRTAIEMIDDAVDGLPSRADSIKAEYLAARLALAGDLDTLARWLGWEPPFSYRDFLRRTPEYWLPWEKARSIRALNHSTAQELDTYRRVEKAVSDGRRVALPRDPWGFEEQRRWVRATPLMEHVWPGAYSAARGLVNMETDRRAVRLQLALKAWQLEHGELPKDLQSLVGPYLKEVPIDPYAGEPFRYFPDGLPVDLTRRSSYYAKPEVVLAANEPFVWSAGVKVILTGKEEDEPVEKYSVQPFPAQTHRPSTENEIWAWGAIFPVPQGK